MLSSNRPLAVNREEMYGRPAKEYWVSQLLWEQSSYIYIYDRASQLLSFGWEQTTTNESSILIKQCKQNLKDNSDTPSITYYV